MMTRNRGAQRLLCALIFTLAACGGPESESADHTVDRPEQAAQPEASAPTPPAPAVEPQTSPPELTADSQEDGKPGMAPPLDFVAMDGRQVSLHALRGKRVLVFFFSTDCPHCQNAADELAPIYADLKDKGVEVLGLALNPTAREKLGGFVANHNVAFPVTATDRPTFSRFAGLSVMQRFYYPYLIFVDPEGRVSAVHQGSDQAFFADFDGNVRALLSGS